MTPTPHASSATDRSSRSRPTAPRPTRYRVVDSPIGPLTIAGPVDPGSGHDVVSHLCQHDQAHPPGDRADWVPAPGADAFASVVEQLDAYFAGDLEEFDVALELHGTEFQRQVWQGLTDIPYGVTWSYAQLARHVGRPGASRAVGLANGRNPVSVIVPCHRVIGADGSMTGYGGGIDRKVWLLEHEQGRR